MKTLASTSLQMPVSLYFLSSGTSRCYPGVTTFSPVGQIAHKKHETWKKIITEIMYAKVLCLLMNICHFIRYSRFYVNEYSFRVLPRGCQFIFFCFVFVLFIAYEITQSIYMEIIAKQGVATVACGFPFSSFFFMNEYTKSEKMRLWWIPQWEFDEYFRDTIEEICTPILNYLGHINI